ncbi:MAG: pimeloyl-ACP methyl ester esterase BioH [Thiotrichaceae bacterium]
MNTVFTNISGQGEPLVVLHGWGMIHKVWSPVKTELERHFQVVWVDLPGHGQSKGMDLGSLDETVESIISMLNEVMPIKPVHVMGWSLGGLIAQRLAEQFPDHVRSLVLVASSPSFVQRDNWPHAMATEVLDGFVESLQNNFALTIKRFLSLQFMGVKGVQADVKRLREDILTTPPDINVLQAGLLLLKNTDLRNAKITCPQHWIFGELDKLVPVSVAEDITALSERDQQQIILTTITTIKNAGHAPFISHPDEFVSSIRDSLLIDSQVGSL